MNKFSNKPCKLQTTHVVHSWGNTKTYSLVTQNNQSLKPKNSSFPSHGYHHYRLEYVGPEKELSAILVTPKCQRKLNEKLQRGAAYVNFCKSCNHTVLIHTQFKAINAMGNRFFYQTNFYFVCMSILSAWIYVHHMCVWYPKRSEEGFKCLGLELLTVVSQSVCAINKTNCWPISPEPDDNSFERWHLSTYGWHARPWIYSIQMTLTFLK